MAQSFSRLRCLVGRTVACKSANHVKQVHAQLITNGSKVLSLFANLIEYYCQFPTPAVNNYALLVLQHYDELNVYLFNTLLRCTKPKYSILLFSNCVSKLDLNLDAFTYIFVLGACARFPSIFTLWVGRQIHARMVKHGFSDSNVMVPTTAINFYASNKDIDSARRVFDKMVKRSYVTWNAMISGYCSQKNLTKQYACDAFFLFRDMLVHDSGVTPSDTTMVCLLSAASQLGLFETGACVHAFIAKMLTDPENDIFIGTGLVDMYSKCGCLDDALLVFGRMNEKNVLTWTAMATGLAFHGEGKQALEYLDEMDACGIKPNHVTFTGVLSACCHAGLVEEGLFLFHKMKRGFDVTPQMQHYGCIVDLLGRAGHLEEAFAFVIGMPIKPDLILWRSLLSACKVHGDVAMGEKVGKLLLEIQPDKSAEDLALQSNDFVALSNVYASAERWIDVETVREGMKVKQIQNKAGFSSVQIVHSSDDKFLWQSNRGLTLKIS